MRIRWSCVALSLWLAAVAVADEIPPGSVDEADTVAEEAGGGAAATGGMAATGASTSEPARETLPLSLKRAIELALENNLDVEVQRFDPLISGEREREAWGAYDPELFAEFGYSAIKNPTAFTLSGVNESLDRSTDGFGGFRGLVPYLGSQYNLQFDGQRTRSNAFFQGLLPEIRSSFSLSFTQPLLRNLIWNQPWTRVKTSRVLYDQSLQSFRRQVMDSVRRVEDGYWNLIATDEQKAVAEKSLETARALLDQTNTQYEVGVVSKVEVVEAEAGVADREVNVIRAQNFYLGAQDLLNNLIFGTDFTAETTMLIEPTDRPDDYIQYKIDAKVATERAFELRPELVIADDEIERQRLELKFAKNQRLPQLDARFTYGNRGIAGKPRCAFFNPVDQAACLADPSANLPPETDFADSLDNFIEHDASDQFSARALFSIPIPNGSARSRVSQQELLLRQTQVRKRQLEQSIILEVRNAVRDLESAQEGIEAARRASAAAAEQLRAERIRLEYGESTPFDVLQREEDFVQAESQEIGALQLYRTSVTGLDRAQGTILRNRNISIDEVSAVR